MFVGNLKKVREYKKGGVNLFTKIEGNKFTSMIKQNHWEGIFL